MDKLNAYREAVKGTLTEFTRGGYLPPQYLKDVTLFDETEDRYAVITQGWDKGEYVNELTAEIDIIEEKVYIKLNTTDVNLRQMLVKNGINEKDIETAYLQKA
jgi:hypothetical protein